MLPESKVLCHWFTLRAIQLSAISMVQRICFITAGNKEFSVVVLEGVNPTYFPLGKAVLVTASQRAGFSMR
jgi:hypothetical protein